MAKFSDETKRKFSKFRLDEAEAALERLTTRVVPESDGYMLSPASTAPAMVFDLLQCGLRRTLELTHAAIAEVNAQKMNTSCLLSRAAFETECLMYDSMLRVKTVTDSNDTHKLGELYDHLRRVVLGGKSEHRVSEDILAVSILTAVQRVSRHFGDVPWKLYEVLSEYAHPNYHGMLATYTERGKDQGVTTFVDRRPGRLEASTSAALSALANGLDILELAFTTYDGLIDDLVLLAEKRNHEAGKWPKDLPYPLVRPLKWTMSGDEP